MNRRTVLLGAGVAPLMFGTRAMAHAPSAEDANIETVRRFIEMVNTRNMAIVGDVIAPNYESSSPGNAPGIEAYKSRLQSSFDQQDYTWTEFATTEQAIMAQGDSVAFMGQFTGTTTTGKLVDLPDVRWFELADGLIKTWYGGPDSGRMTEAMYG